MSMYDPSLQWAVLSLLEKWQRLPLSDVIRMLDPLQRPLFREELVKDMEWEGLITLRLVGDEPVLELSPRGKGRLADRSS
jgi:hypothetical protein